MNNTNHALTTLRGLHLPEPITLWPFAPGWYFILLIVLVLISFLLYKIINNIRKTQAKKAALAYLDNLHEKFHDDTHKLSVIADLSTLLRRVALARFPRQEVAGLSGKSWLGFLDQHGQTNKFTRGIGKILITAPYSRSIPKQSEDLFPLVQEWIELNG